MVTIETFRNLALSFAEATEQPHFEKASFRIKKKIFATLDAVNQKVTINLSEIDQSVFSAFDPTMIYPVPGGWGRQGWTMIELGKIEEDFLMDALTCSYRQVAPKKLGELYRRNDEV
jgi:predicted DNA-binding protein (MmcQ/YjbR family)